MNRFILAACLLSIVPISEALMDWFPPQEVITIEERPVPYTDDDRKAMAVLWERVEEEQAEREVLAGLFVPPQGEDVEGYTRSGE